MSLQFLIEKTGKNQLYYQNHLFYKTKSNYWQCIQNNCRASVTTSGITENDEAIRPANNETVIHFDTDHKVVLGEYICNKALSTMTIRAYNEIVMLNT